MLLRSRALGVETVVCERSQMNFEDKSYTGVLLQYPDTDGSIYDMTPLVEAAHAHGVCLCCALSPPSQSSCI